ncbi:MAG: ADP-ribosylation factor family protein [Candidatus Heimdallarchaeota archaeon]
MISYVWIFRNSGIPIVSRAYSPKLELDEPLLTGILTAFFAFAKELNKGTFEALRMTNLTLFGSHEKNLFFVIGTEPHVVDDTFVTRVMHQIKQTFFQTFPDKLLKKSAKAPHLIPHSMVEAFQKKLDIIINQQARHFTVISDYDLEKAKQTFRAVVKEELNPITARDELLEIFDQFELKSTMKQVTTTLNTMLSVTEQFAAESSLQILLQELNRFIGLWGKTAKISIIGLDRAGKTAILNTIQGRDYHTTPTTSLSVESINFRNLTLVCWDIPGQERYRTQWIPYTRGTHILVFVVDGADPQRWEEARQELTTVLDEFPNTPLALLLNKADLPYYTGKKVINKGLILILQESKRPFCMFETSAVTGEGLEDLFDWIFHRLAEILPY